MDSLARASRDANVDPPRRHFRVFLFPHEIDLGCADVGMSRELPHLVHGRPIPDRVVNGGFSQRVDSNAPASQPLRINACGAAVFLHEPPRGFAIQVTSFHATSVRLHGPKERPFLVLGDARSREVGQHGPRESSRIFRRFLFRFSVT